jgi:hypothetical protein
MTNSGELDAWLEENGIFLESYSGILQNGSQLIFICPTMQSFKKAALDWKASYVKDLCFKCNSGASRYTYIIAGSSKGFAITISDTAPAPGVVVEMNPVEEYFKGHATQLWLFKHGLKVIGTAVVLLTITFVVAHPDEVPVGTAVLYVLKIANDWLDKFNPDAYMQGVGKDAKKKK